MGAEMGDLLKQLRSPSCNGTVPCWTAEEAARQIENLQAQLQSKKARAERAEAELAALRAGIAGLAQKWNEAASFAETKAAKAKDYPTQVTARGACMMHRACADELARLLPDSGDGGREP